MDKLDRLDNISQAMKYFDDNYPEWDKETEEYEEFIQLIQRGLLSSFSAAPVLYSHPVSKNKQQDRKAPERRSAVAKERQRDTHSREQPNGHTDVDGKVSEE